MAASLGERSRCRRHGTGALAGRIPCRMPPQPTPADHRRPRPVARRRHPDRGRSATSSRSAGTRRRSPTPSRRRCAALAHLDGDPRRQHRRGPHRPGPRRAGGPRRPHRHRAADRPAQPPTRRSRASDAVGPRDGRHEGRGRRAARIAAAGAPSRAADLTFVFYECEEVDGRAQRPRAGSAATTPSCSHADFAVLLEPTDGARRGRLQGHAARRGRHHAASRPTRRGRGTAHNAIHDAGDGARPG